MPLLQASYWGGWGDFHMIQGQFPIKSFFLMIRHLPILRWEQNITQSWAQNEKSVAPGARPEYQGAISKNACTGSILDSPCLSYL